MKKAIVLFSLCICLFSRCKGPEGPEGPQGNANVIQVTFGPKDIPGRQWQHTYFNIPKEISDTFKSKQDFEQSVVLTYVYNKSTGRWFHLPGNFSGVPYEVRHYLPTIEISRGAAGEAHRFDTTRVVLISPSLMRSARTSEVDYHDYEAVKNAFGIKQ